MSRKALHLTVDQAAPLPLGYPAVLDRAVELRQRGGGFSYTVISELMAFYHGFDRGPSWWRDELAGRVPSRARGRSFEKAAA